MKIPLREGIVSQWNALTTCSWSLRNPLSIDARLSMLQSASATISHCRKLLGTPEFGKDYMGLKMLDSIQVGRNLAEKNSASLILPKSRKFWNKIVSNSFSGLFSTLGDKEDATFSSYRDHLITLPLLNKKPNWTHLLRHLLFC